MHAIVQLADEKRLINLLYAIEAAHDQFSHDEDLITFRRNDGFTLHVRLSINYVSFGRAAARENRRFWTENISAGEIKKLLLWFIRKEDDSLRKFKRWIWKPRTYH